MAAHHKKSSFRNPWPPRTSFISAVASICRIPLTLVKPFATPARAVKTVPCEFDLYDDLEVRGTNVLATWLGHAGFLVQIPPSEEQKAVKILFDPIFAERASPVNWFGPKRWLPPPCPVEALPQVDYLVISHNHYDHLDIETIQQVYRPTMTILVPLGVKQIFLDTVPNINADGVHEMDWWDVRSFPDGVQVICTPAQHNSGRGIHDQRKTLWASWIVRRTSASVYHAGDTGYATASGPCPAFAEIGQKYGPFDLAMIPIWRGASLSILGRAGLRLTEEGTESLLSTLHASPQDAVKIAADVRAKHSVAMHFGTFCGSEDEAIEPIILLKEALAGKDLEETTNMRGTWQGDEGFRVIDIGQTVTVPIMAS
ncbi:Metallo-hydrolase/oxidoreductase [Hymenopellis radicata]|nr:Metallo-hydrolase/oxidoreductase [Hymenopellis radicata]